MFEITVKKNNNDFNRFINKIRNQNLSLFFVKKIKKDKFVLK